jgi:hypothetical protein
MAPNEQHPKQTKRLIAACAVSLYFLMAPGGAAGDDWRFVLPPPGAAFEHPTMRAISFSRTRPDDVKEMVSFRGSRQRFAQLRFGSPGSVRVTVVLDELRTGEFELYVDADRNRRIEEKDKIPGQERTWRLPLQVAVVQGETTRLIPRGAIFRLGATGLTFSFAAAGYLEGSVEIGGRQRPARRTDGDGNGFLSDPADRLWIDLDDDGAWDPASEQFLYAPIIAVGETRYVVRSDELGTRLRLEPLAGTGTLKLVLNPPSAASRLADARATLIGRDGSAIALDARPNGVTVPAGEYRVGSVWLILNDPGGGPRWNFTFSDDDGKRLYKWYKVDNGESIQIEAIGRLELETGVEFTGKPVRASDDVTLQPRLYTADGLSINACFRGSPASPADQDSQGAEIQLLGSRKQPLAVARSGFR